MLDLTLEWLSSAGVQELILLTCAHASMIRKYADGGSRAVKKFIKVTVIECGDCLSAGDALRQLDQQNIIRSDFLLVQGDVVSNMRVDRLLAAHRQRRQVDKQCIATIVVRPVGAMQRQCRLGDSDLTLGVDGETKRLLYYEDDERVSELHLDREGCIDGRARFELRNDLQDCDVLLCAPETLYVFRENFDYQRIRQDFVCGILSDETLGNKIHIFELDDNEYAARVHNLRSYDAVSRDIIMRWTYPFVPDVMDDEWASAASGADQYSGPKMRCTGHYVYIDSSVMVPNTSNIGSYSLVGAETVTDL